MKIWRDVRDVKNRIVAISQSLEKERDENRQNIALSNRSIQEIEKIMSNKQLSQIVREVLSFHS